MVNYADHELNALLADLESDLVERKESLKGDAPTTVREAVCAFANDLPGHRRPGVVFVGARDDGSPAGLVLTDYRNPNLAEALRVLGFVQRYGAGIPTARRLLAANGNPAPEFDVQPTFVGVTVRVAR